MRYCGNQGKTEIHPQDLATWTEPPLVTSVQCSFRRRELGRENATWAQAGIVVCGEVNNPLGKFSRRGGDLKRVETGRKWH